MNILLISYDLFQPGQDYPKLIEAIKSYGDWCKIHKSVWAIRTTSGASAIHRNLSGFVDGNDKLFVSGLTGDAAWNGLPIGSS